jgi:phosphodiester glycosidase
VGRYRAARRPPSAGAAPRLRFAGARVDTNITVQASTAPTSSRDLGRARSFRHHLADGTATTVHTAIYARAGASLDVVAMAPAEQLATWCARSGLADALVGGFFVTPVGTPLGELWIGGDRCDTTPFDAPWGAVRSCVAIDEDRIRLGPRDAFPLRPAGDLLQAGPMLASGGVVAGAAIDDREGFTAGSVQFDSDIRDGRHPRAALGIDDHRIVAVVCDGRADDEAGLTLAELAALMVSLGVRDAINLDGGGSATLIAGGRMLNRPRASWNVDLVGGRPLATAIAIRPRAGGQRGASAATAA